MARDRASPILASSTRGVGLKRGHWPVIRTGRGLRWLSFGLRGVRRQHPRFAHLADDRDHDGNTARMVGRVWIGDRGMASAGNLAWLRATRRRYIIGAPKSEPKQFAGALASAEGWRTIREGVEVKLTRAAETGEIIISCRSAERLSKEQAIHEKFSCRIEAALDRLAGRIAGAKRRLDPARVNPQIVVVPCRRPRSRLFMGRAVAAQQIENRVHPARTSVLRGRPGFASGINGSNRAHRTSFISLGNPDFPAESRPRNHFGDRESRPLANARIFWVRFSETEELAPQRILVKALPVVDFLVLPVLAVVRLFPLVEFCDVMVAGGERLFLANGRHPFVHRLLVVRLQLVQFLLKIR